MRDVLAQDLAVGVGLALQQRAGHGDADAAAEVAHQVEEAGGVAHVLARDRVHADRRERHEDAATAPMPWMNCGQKKSQ